MIPILEWIFSISTSIEWDNELIEKYKVQYSNENILNGLQCKESYSGGSFDILKAVLKYGISNKNVAVLGSELPWVEAILLNNNNKVTTIDYNTENKKTDRIKIVNYFEVKKSKYDCFVCYSSVEHSGLGRYGEPLNENGDFEAMTFIYENLKKNGLLFLAIPIGSDALVINAHRIYGNIRYPVLIKDFKELECSKNKEILFNLPLSKTAIQPLIILQK